MNPPTELFGRWLHRHEDDEGDVEVYRPAAEAFPRSRGRDGFEVRPDGGFTHVGIGRGDGSTETAGRWRCPDGRRLEVTLDNGNAYTLELVAVTDDEVRVRRRYG
jgi:hypothetical protein